MKQDCIMYKVRYLHDIIAKKEADSDIVEFCSCPSTALKKLLANSIPLFFGDVASLFMAAMRDA